MVRKAVFEDLENILELYKAAREFMRKTGNPNQWGDSHPARELLEGDIPEGRLYVVERDGEICGAFALIFGEDPTYSYIEGGSWISDEPYGTIHRLGSNGKASGIFAECVQFCLSQIAHLRADTHHDNKVMQALLEKQGFVKRGVIYLENGDPRVAYERV